MANKKISELTAGTTPLTGDELVPVVQGGATVRVPASALQGADGSQIHTGSGAPTAAAAAGDLYIDTATGDLYEWTP